MGNKIVVTLRRLIFFPRRLEFRKRGFIVSAETIARKIAQKPVYPARRRNFGYFGSYKQRSQKRFLVQPENFKPGNRPEIVRQNGVFINLHLVLNVAFLAEKSFDAIIVAVKPELYVPAELSARKGIILPSVVKILAVGAVRRKPVKHGFDKGGEGGFSVAVAFENLVYARIESHIESA